MNTYFDYIFYRGDTAVGVNKKIKDTVSAVNSLGMSAREVPVHGSFFLKRLNMLLAIARSDAKVIVLRHDFLLPISYLTIILWKRLRGVVVLVDIPTPMVTALKEFFVAPGPRFFCYLKSFLLLIQHPWVLWPASCVIQYSDESPWFLFGLRRKTRLESNGIMFPDQTPAFKVRTDKTTYRFIGVGLVADWHGYDRLISGLASYYKNLDSILSEKKKVVFEIIGDGPAIRSLENIVAKEGLNEFVKFRGVVVGADLDNLLSESDLAVGTLGLHRISLNTASPLKNRQYCSLGVPFICSHSDPDFDNAWFVCRLNADDDAIDISKLIVWLDALRSNEMYREKIYAYGKGSVDYRVKWKRIIESLSIGRDD